MDKNINKIDLKQQQKIKISLFICPLKNIKLDLLLCKIYKI